MKSRLQTGFSRLFNGSLHIGTLCLFAAVPAFAAGAPAADTKPFSVVLEAPAKWGAEPPGGPIVVKTRNEVTGQREKLNCRLHGTGHSELQAPPVFIANFSESGSFTVNVQGYCCLGARLEIRDETGKILLAEAFPKRKTGTDGQKHLVKIDKPFTVNLPAGSHRITVRNPGFDWILVDSYALTGLLPMKDEDEQRLRSTVIDASRTFQTIEGWGGNIYAVASQYAASDPDLYDKAFKELKTTHMRVRSFWHDLENPNDNDDPNLIDFEALKKNDKGLVHDEFLLLQEMTRRGVKPLLAVFNMPSWIARVGQPEDWKYKGNAKYRLRPEMEPEFVESIAAYLLFARKEYGVTFAAVSLQNEPMHGIYIPQSPESLWRITQALAERLKKETYATTFYCPDLSCPQYTGWAEKFFSQKGAPELSCCVSYHSYRRTLKGLHGFRDLGKRLGLPVWVTEQNYTSGAPGDRFRWSHAMKNAVCLHDVLVEGDAALSLHWSYVAIGSKGLVMYQPEKKSWPPTYHMLKHFYNTIPLGSVRIQVTPSNENEVRVVAFLLPDKHAFTVVLINSGKQRKKVDLVLRGVVPGKLVCRQSTATEQFAPVDNAKIDGDKLTVDLSPLSVTSIQATGFLLPGTPSGSSSHLLPE